MANTYQMPAVEVGDIVLWYATSDKEEKPLPALVTQVGTGNLGLNIFSSQMFNAMLKDGVRHKSDPALQKRPAGDEGVWDYRPADARLAELYALVVGK